MNKAGRKEIQDIIGGLAELRSRLEMLRDEEQEKYDNMPEGLHTKLEGRAITEGISTLDDAISSIKDVESNLEEV